MIAVERSAEVTSFHLTDRARTSIGRSAACDLVLDDPSVSRIHAFLLSHQGQRVLQDAGSRNGTYLDSVRLSPGEAVVLREGDVVELGGQRLVYDRFSGFGTGELLWAPPADPEADAGHWPVVELLREAHARLDLVQRVALQVAIDQATAGVGRAEGVGRTLEMLVRCLPASAGVALVEDAGGALRPIACRPGPEAKLWLVPLARAAWAAGEGKLQLSWSASGRNDETQTIGLESAAAVPFEGPQGGGVLAVRRAGGARLDRSDLQLLAVAGERLSLALAARACSGR